MTQNTEDIQTNHILQSEKQIDKEINKNEIVILNVNENKEQNDENTYENLRSENEQAEYVDISEGCLSDEGKIHTNSHDHLDEVRSDTSSHNHLNEHDLTEVNVSGSQSTEIKSEITSTKSNVSEDESDDFIPDNISLSLSVFQEENEKLKSNIENLELIVSQQQKKINENDVILHDFEQAYTYNEKLRHDLENRLHMVII